MGSRVPGVDYLECIIKMVERAATSRASEIGLLNEKSLHGALKEWYSCPGDRFEVAVDGYVVDIVRGELLIEIQTSGFSTIKAKLGRLAQTHRVRLLYPIPRVKWIVRVGEEGHRLGRRKSPKRGSLDLLFLELVSIPHVFSMPKFSLEVLYTQEEEVRRYDGRRGRRRKGWVVQERRLLDVLERQSFDSPADILALLPDDLKEPFTTADLAEAMEKPRWVAQKMAYCLRGMGAAVAVGKTGNALLYERNAVFDKAVIAMKRYGDTIGR